MKFQNWVKDQKSSKLFGSVVGLRRFLSHVERNEATTEHFLYVGCIHGANEHVYEELEEIYQNPSVVDYLIFTGDLTGSKEIEDEKHTFYQKKENKVEGYDQYEYFGDWIIKVSKEKRIALYESIIKSMELLVVFLKRLQDRGVKIFLLEGNWDSESALSHVFGNDFEIDFSPQKLFASRGFQFITDISTLETDHAFHVFLPYEKLRHFTSLPHTVIDQIKRAKEAKKKIIAVGHAEANWKIHHLDHPQKEGDTRAQVIKNFGRVLHAMEPDEVIYPHQHARIHDEKGNVIDLNNKYLLTFTPEGVKLADKTKEKIKGDVLASYLPFGIIASEDYR